MDKHLDSFHFGAIINKMALNVLLHSFHFAVHLRAELLGHKVNSAKVMNILYTCESLIVVVFIYRPIL